MLVNTPISPLMPTTADKHKENSKSLATVRGRVETLSRRKGLSFRLYELASDSAVLCHMDPNLEDTILENTMLDIWGQVVDVTGTVLRDARTDMPISISQITNVDLVDEGDPDGYLKARGAIHISEPAEVLVRRMRDES